MTERKAERQELIRGYVKRDKDKIQQKHHLKVFNMCLLGSQVHRAPKTNLAIIENEKSSLFVRHQGAFSRTLTNTLYKTVPINPSQTSSLIQPGTSSME